jgi:quinol monooxygenase YgiN
MPLFALLVEFVIRPEAMAGFLPLMLENAALSLRDEPGCRQFDVLTAPDDPNRIVLYEIYDDQQAFDAHLASDHFKRFAAATGDMIASRSLRRLVLIGPDDNAAARNRA